jgi:hypothetical protein
VSFSCGRFGSTFGIDNDEFFDYDAGDMTSFQKDFVGDIT